ncbi:MAG: DUF255 domain-containing protein [Deltaproteobacteria bacterium]|nr:DUF255 domain-containing protein [Deltaproteobacteria bacterium]
MAFSARFAHSSALPALFGLLLCAPLASCGGPSPQLEGGLVALGDSAQIEWQTWGAPAFERARREGKMVLVDVGIEGCTACRWMFEDTYQDSEVVRRVNERFVPIAVDANVRPDLGDRYARWGWPATIVLSPDGAQVFAVRGNKRPRNFIPILDELIDRQRRGTLEDEARVPITGPVAEGALAEAWASSSSPSPRSNTRFFERISGTTVTNANRRSGRFGDGPVSSTRSGAASSSRRGGLTGRGSSPKNALCTKRRRSMVLPRPTW